MCQLFLCDVILFCQISETLILKFTAITPESLDMSRMIMSVVSAAIGGEQQGSSGSGGGGSASLVSSSFSLQTRRFHVISVYLCSYL